jgi:hypothetical protein
MDIAQRKTPDTGDAIEDENENEARTKEEFVVEDVVEERICKIPDLINTQNKNKMLGMEE